jgi:ureidoacrylate peracid hydrolase
MHNSRISVEALQRSSQRRGGKIHPFRDVLDPARTAHLVIDLQNGFLEPGAPVEIPEAREIVSTVNAISAAVRKAGGINVFIRYVSRSDDTRKWSTFYSTMLPQAAGSAIVETFSPGQHGMNLWPQLGGSRD